MRPVVRVATMLWAVAIIFALTVALAPGAAALVRGLLGYRLAPAAGSLALTVQIATHNARWVLVLVLLAMARARLTRPARLDAVVCLDAAANASLVGCAAGAYGLASLPYLVHMPVESAAMAAALGGYRVGSRRLFAAALLLVAIAAFCESYLTPQ